jgi:flagellar biosynthetic protein FliP
MRAFVSTLVGVALALVFSVNAPAQEMYGPPADSGVAPPAFVNGFNPVSALEDASNAVPGFDGGLSGAINILVLLTVLTLAPAILIMTTSFVRIIVVLGLLKQAMGTQTLPPSQVILGLSLFMTFLVMSPTMERVYEEAIGPYQRGEIVNQLEMWDRAKQPVRDFMFAQIEATGNWSSLYMILNYKGVDTSEPSEIQRADVDTLTLVAAFMLSELKTAFLMGFRIYLPFLVIDIIISSVLISMSMMMLPPVLISLPFKILLFVMVDGWQLVVGSLLTSFVQPGAPAQTALVDAMSLGVFV